MDGRVQRNVAVEGLWRRYWVSVYYTMRGSRQGTAQGSWPLVWQSVILSETQSECQDLGTILKAVIHLLASVLYS